MKLGVDPALEDEVLDQSTHRVVGKGGHHRGAQSKAAPQAPGYVVFTAAFPGRESCGPCGLARRRGRAAA